VLSPLVMAALMIGVTKLLLLQPGGLWLVLGAVAGTVLIYWVIDPKLRAVSQEYEAQQAQYVAELEQRLRWQEERETRHGAKDWSRSSA
jgi:hypothetical protein